MMTAKQPVLLLASRNRKKMLELADKLAAYEIQLMGGADFPDVPEVEETGETFAENAALKAREVAVATGHWSLADDSGIQVDALKGRPGVYSARYAGDGCTDEDNNNKLLEELADVPPERRGAQFVCNIAVSDPQGAIRLQVQAHCRGRIINSPRGPHGFGYDPLFLIPEYHRTFGELGMGIKRVLSHRARALEKVIPRLVTLITA